MSDPRAADASVIQVGSTGVSPAFLVAAPLGVLIVFCAVGGLVTHTSVGVVVVAAITLMFGVAVLASSAYSVWGACSILVDSAECVVTRTLWGRRRVWRFAASRIRSVFLYNPPPAYIMWPGLSGAHVRVAVERWPRSVPVAAGLHAPREMLDRIRELFLKAAEDAGVVAPGGAGAT